MKNPYSQEKRKNRTNNSVILWNLRKCQKMIIGTFLKIQFQMFILCSKNKVNFMELPSKQSHFIVNSLYPT